MIYTGSATSRAYVQSSSNPLEIFHSLCKTPFTNSEPHRDNPSLVFKNPLQQETHGLLIPFQKYEEEKKKSLLKGIDCTMKTNQNSLLNMQVVDQGIFLRG